MTAARQWRWRQEPGSRELGLGFFGAGKGEGREWESEEREARLGFLLVDAGEGGPGGAQLGHGGMAPVLGTVAPGKKPLLRYPPPPRSIFLNCKKVQQHV